MRRVICHRSLPGCILAVWTTLAAVSSAQAPATLILHTGRIVTLNPRNEIAEAIAVRDGRLLAVGTTSDILKLKDAHTQVVDLGGRTVIPGLVESHSHPTSYGMHIFQPDLSKPTTLAGIVQLVEAKVKQSRPGEWITNSRI
jgi:predicted amidohydrolase YtcJ